MVDNSLLDSNKTYIARNENEYNKALFVFRNTGIRVVLVDTMEYIKGEQDA
jgi:hypothetical protein